MLDCYLNFDGLMVKSYLKQDVFVKNNDPNNGQFQRWLRSHGQNYLDRSWKILSKEMFGCNMKVLIFIIYK